MSIAGKYDLFSPVPLFAFNLKLNLIVKIWAFRYKKRLKQLRDGVPPSMAVVPLCTNPSSTSTAVTNFA